MDATRWERLCDLFQEGCGFSHEGRHAFLNELTNDDLSLRNELEGLLRELDDQSGPHSSPSLVNAFGLASEANHDPLLGSRLGPYQIVRRLGQGGFGDVYQATRTSDYDQDVAIKFLRMGLQTDASILQRFELERQILADLSHENIAKLMDGGTTEQSRPYLIIEYVSGRPITKYCEDHELSIRERLELFARVARAVAYAHQYGVIHRDLKPSNILVTDGGVPKLVDFGIAKLTDVNTRFHPTTLTGFGLRPFTPQYASPEQMRGERVGTASDVYSLGLLLYELLTNTTPYSVDQTTSIEEIIRLVCESKPTPPSKCDSRCNAASSRTVGDRQNARLYRTLSGDLDNIVLMAIRKEPDRRYQSAAELCDDIRRYQAGNPVIARADSFWYRAQTLVQRNLAPVLAGILISISLVVGSVVSYIGWHQADQAAEKYREQLYVSDMQVAWGAYHQGQLDEVRTVLGRHSPTNSRRVGFEWHLLEQLARPVSPLFFEKHDAPVNEVAIVPDTQQIVSVGDDAAIRIWTPTAGEHAVLGMADGPLHAVATSPCGRFVAAGKQTVSIWDLVERRHVRNLGTFAATVESLAFSPDGLHLAIGVRYDGAFVVSVACGTIIANKPGGARYERLTFFPNGDLLIPARPKEDDRTFLQRWTGNFKELKTEYHAFGLSSVRHGAISRDGKWIAAASQYGPSVLIFDADTGEIVTRTPPQGDGVRSLALSPDDAVLAGGYEDGKVRLYSFSPSSSAEEKLESLFDVKFYRANQVSKSPLPALSFVGNDQLVACASEGTVSVWPTRPTMTGRLGPAVRPHHGPEVSLRGDRLAISDGRNEIWMNDSDRLGQWCQIDVEEAVTCVEVARVDSGFFVGRHSGDVDWFGSGAPKTQYSISHGNMNVNDICLSPSDDLLAVVGNEKKVSVWSVPEGRPLWQQNLPDAGLVVAVSPNGELLAVGGHYRNLDIFDMLTGNSKHNLAVDGDVTSLSWSNSGEKLAIGQSNGTILLHDMSDGESTRLLGHRNGVKSLVFSHDDQTLISGDKDSTIRLWHLSTRRNMGVLYRTRTSCWITGLFMTRDGRRLVGAINGNAAEGGAFSWQIESSVYTAP